MGVVARLVVLVEARDRPGLLADILGVLAGLGASVVTHVGYTEDGAAKILFILDSPRAPEEVEEALSRHGIEASAAELGPEAGPIIAEFISGRPILVSLLESHLAPSDLLDAIIRLDREERREVYRILSTDTLARILVLADPDTIEEVLESVELRKIVRAVSMLDADEATDVVQKMPPPVRRRILHQLPPELRRKVSKLLEYPPETVGGVMTTDVPVLREDQTVYEALTALREGDYDVRDTVFVVDGEGRLKGLVAIDALISEVLTTRLGRIAAKPRITVGPEMDREEAARLMTRYSVTRLPVVDGEGRLLGALVIEDVASILSEEAAEDIALIGAVEKPRERYLRASILDLVRSRIAWLLVIYVIESVTANVLAAYSTVIERAGIIAAFIPLIMDTGGNVGSQATATMIRALALGEISEYSGRDVLLVVGKEAATASVIGLVMAGIGFAFSYLVSQSINVALAVAATLFTVVLLADLVGSLLPITARRLGLDPAVISAPLITTVVDVSVVFIYMTLSIVFVLGAQG